MRGDLPNLRLSHLLRLEDILKFVLDGLGAGRYTLELVGWSLPENHQVVGSAIKEIILEAGQALLVESFEVKYVEPRVLQRFQAP